MGYLIFKTIQSASNSASILYAQRMAPSFNLQKLTMMGLSIYNYQKNIILISV